MPALKNEVLQRAVDAVVETAGAENVKLSIINQTANQVVYNYTNWVVCGQNPSAEKSVKVGPKPQTVYIAVKRRIEGC